MINTNIKARRIYKSKKFGMFLVIGSTKFGCSIVKLINECDTELYNKLNAHTSIQSDNEVYVACIDRVTYVPWNMADEFYLISKLSTFFYTDIINCINQYYMGNIMLDGSIFRYKEDTDEKNKKSSIVVLAATPNNPVKDIDDDVTLASIKDMRNFDTGYEDEESWKNDEIQIKEAQLKVCEDAIFNSKFIEAANELGLKIKAEYNDDTGDAKVLIDLLKYRKSDKDHGNSASKARYTNPEKMNNYKRRYFTEEEVEQIAKMNSNSVASKYECSKTVATEMIKNAKRLLGHDITSHDIVNNFTCYFNEGKTIDEVVEIYPDLPRYIIERNYKLWEINSNIYNNQYVIKRWNKVIDENDYEKMSNAVHGNTIEHFAINEGCTMNCANDIIAKMADILARNPLTCAGFGVAAFDESEMMRILKRANERDYIDDKVTIDLYNRTEKLLPIYTKYFDQHSDILTGKIPIPTEVESQDEDSFMSLIWNRYHRWAILTKNRKLSDYQKAALDHGTPRLVANLFMINYNRAVGLIARYKKSKEKSKE